MDFKFIKYSETYNNIAEQFNNDKGINEYLHFYPNNSYLIEYKGNIIGFFKLTKMYNNTIIDLQLGILEKYRHQGLGTKVHQYISDFAFSLYPEGTSIILNIDYKNEISKKVATKLGFKLNMEEYENRQMSGEGQDVEPYYKEK